MQPKVNYPAAQIVGPGVTTPALTASAASVIKAPTSSSGAKPAFFRITATGTAHVRWGNATSISAVTSDTLVLAGEALYINSLGLSAISAIHPLAGATAGSVVNVVACEEGALHVPSDTSGLG